LRVNNEFTNKQLEFDKPNATPTKFDIFIIILKMVVIVLIWPMLVVFWLHLEKHGLVVRQFWFYQNEVQMIIKFKVYSQLPSVLQNPLEHYSLKYVHDQLEKLLHDQYGIEPSSRTCVYHKPYPEVYDTSSGV
jgi:hypothetical protein